MHNSYFFFNFARKIREIGGMKRILTILLVLLTTMSAQALNQQVLGLLEPEDVADIAHGADYAPP